MKVLFLVPLLAVPALAQQGTPIRRLRKNALITRKYETNSNTKDLRDNDDQRKSSSLSLSFSWHDGEDALRERWGRVLHAQQQQRQPWDDANSFSMSMSMPPLPTGQPHHVDHKNNEHSRRRATGTTTTTTTTTAATDAFGEMGHYDNHRRMVVAADVSADEQLVQHDSKHAVNAFGRTHRFE